MNPELVRSVLFGLILAIGISLTLPTLLWVRITLLVAPGASGLLGYTDNIPFHAPSTHLDFWCGRSQRAAN
jgi:hypothetical protein